MIKNNIFFICSQKHSIFSMSDSKIFLCILFNWIFILLVFKKHNMNYEITLQQEECQEQHIDDFLQFQVYQKLPKAREIITAIPLGSESTKVISNWCFEKHPQFQTIYASQQKLHDYNIQTLSPTNINNNKTAIVNLSSNNNNGNNGCIPESINLYEYYLKKQEVLIYIRRSAYRDVNESFQQPEKMNFVQYDIDRQLKYNNNTTFNLNYSDIPQFTPKTVASDQLYFSSNFESGNLSQVYKVGAKQYDLILGSDINTHNYSHWFYFKAKYRITDSKSYLAQFNLVNLLKSSSLYNKGMKILVYTKKSKWHHAGEKILYKKNRFISKQKQFYTLSFQYEFEDNEDVYFAYSYPYTYTNLNKDLDVLQTKFFRSKIFTREELCRTLIGNRCEIITIGRGYHRHKKIIFISARVHPGETVSSWIAKGILEFLLSDNEIAKRLREQFVFKILPMLNPDGVIHGNYRCNLVGNDLNRQWQEPDRFLHPEIYYYKKYILKTAKERQVAMVLDLHGHSSKKNVFIYGCNEEKDPYASKQYPFILSKMLKSFSYKDCCFQVIDQKEGTARVALWRELNIPNIFTIQSSFLNSENDDYHFTPFDLMNIGQKICESISIYFPNPRKQQKMQTNSVPININTSIINLIQQQKDIFLNQLKIIDNNDIKFFNSVQDSDDQIVQETTNFMNYPSHPNYPNIPSLNIPTTKQLNPSSNSLKKKQSQKLPKQKSSKQLINLEPIGKRSIKINHGSTRSYSPFEKPQVCKEHKSVKFKRENRYESEIKRENIKEKRPLGQFCMPKIINMGVFGEIREPEMLIIKKGPRKGTVNPSLKLNLRDFIFDNLFQQSQLQSQRGKQVIRIQKNRLVNLPLI